MSNRAPKSFTEPTEFGGKCVGGNDEAHGLDLPPPLKTLQCRVCGHPVAGLNGCPECARRKREAEEEAKKERRKPRKAEVTK